MHEVPWIRRGVGKTPADGGCVMQVVDWISRNEWTDNPPCVHPIFRMLAIELNDCLPNENRQELLVLIPRMMNTNIGGEGLTRKLLGWLVRQVYPIYEDWCFRSNYDDHGSILACIIAAEQGVAVDAARAAYAACGAYAVRVVRAADAADVAGGYELLVRLLDFYDELIGRKAVKDIDLFPVCKVMNGGV